MANQTYGNVFEGTWRYLSWLNDPNIRNTTIDHLLFGFGYIEIDEAPMNEFSGLIYGQNRIQDANPDGPHDWQLTLKGSRNYGNPFSVRFQGKEASIFLPQAGNFYDATGKVDVFV